MAILKDALQGIWHHKVRSLLVLALCFTVAAESFQLFALSAGTGAYLDGYRQKMMTEVCIRFNYSSKTAKDAGGWRIATPIDSATLDKLAALPHVTGHNYATYRGTQIQDMINFYNSTSGYENTKGMMEGRQNTYNAANPDNPYMAPTAIVDCVSDTSKLGEFTYGGYKITSGRAVTEADRGKNVIMVLDYLAHNQKWKVGDKVNLTGSYKKQGVIETTIVGIFHDQYAQPQTLPNEIAFNLTPGHSPSYIGSDFDDNIIYAPYDMMDNAFWKDQWKQGDAEITYFYIDDLKNVAGFTTQAKNLLSPELYSVSVDNQKAYDRLYGGAGKVLSSIKNSTMALILIGSALILLICLLSAMRRRGDFELLLKKHTTRRIIAAQVILETLLLVLVPFIIAAFIHGSNLYDTGKKTVNAANSKAQLTSFSAVTTPEQVILGQFRPDRIVIPFGELKSAVTPAAVGEYALLGLGIFAGASVLTAAYVFTFRVRGTKQNENVPATGQKTEKQTEGENLSL